MIRTSFELQRLGYRAQRRINAQVAAICIEAGVTSRFHRNIIKKNLIDTGRPLPRQSWETVESWPSEAQARFEESRYSTLHPAVTVRIKKVTWDDALPPALAPPPIEPAHQTRHSVAGQAAVRRERDAKRAAHLAKRKAYVKRQRIVAERAAVREARAFQQHLDATSPKAIDAWEAKLLAAKPSVKKEFT